MQQKYSEWLCVFIRTTSSWIILSVCLTWSHLTFALQPLTGCLGVAANVHKHEVKKNSFNTLFRSEGCFIPNTLVHSKSDDSKKALIPRVICGWKSAQIITRGHPNREICDCLLSDSIASSENLHIPNNCYVYSEL